MNEPQPIVPSSIDPVDAAIQAALSPEALTPAPVPENDSGGNLEAEKPAPEERRARQYADAAEAKRRAARAEAEARKARQDFQAQQEALSKEKAELEALFTGVKGNKAQLQKLLDRSGLTVDDIARTVLDLEPEVPSADSVAKRALEEAQSLRKELADRDRAKEVEQLQARQQEIYQSYLKRVRDEIAKDVSDKFDLIKDNEAYPTVLQRCVDLLQQNGITDITEQDEVLLMTHVAEQLESELFTQAESLSKNLQKSKKLHKLLGINSPSVTASPETSLRNNDDIAALSPEEASILDSLTQETTAVQRGNKFITNDQTVSSRPTTVRSGYESDIDREIDELVRAYSGQKSGH